MAGSRSIGLLRGIATALLALAVLLAPAALPPSMLAPLTLGAAIAADQAPREIRAPSPQTADAPAPRGEPPALFRKELEAPDTLGVGRVGANVAEQLPTAEALAAALRPNLGRIGYSRALPVIARDTAEMVEFLRNGIVDVVSETPLAAIHYMHQAAASIVLRERRNGRATYSGVVFARSDSPIHMLSDLRGRRIAVDDRNSTAGFLLPLAALRRADIPVVELEVASSEVRPDAVGYYFAKSKESILSAVTRRVADAGAISDDDWRAISSRQPDAAAILRPVHVSEEVPRAFVVVSPAMSTQQREELKRVLESMERDDAGRGALRDYGDVQGFDAIDSDLQHEIDNLETTYALIGKELG